MNDEETVEVETTSEAPAEEVQEEEEAEETVEDLKARLAKAEEERENQKKRAEKAEKKAKEAPKAEGALSTADILAITKANIDDEDLEEVLEYATFKKIGVSEALQSSILKATLAEKAELRKSALAVNTGTGRRAGGNLSDDRLLSDAQKGNMPESEADIARLAVLRFKGRK